MNGVARLGWARRGTRLGAAWHGKAWNRVRCGWARHGTRLGMARGLVRHGMERRIAFGYPTFIESINIIIIFLNI